MKLPKGVYRHSGGYRAKVSRGKLPPINKYFPLGTDYAEMDAWRKDTQAEHRVQRKQRASQGTFEADARRYLNAIDVVAKKDREADIERWIKIFGTRRRETITAADIRVWRNKWANEPRGRAKDGTPLDPYSASTVNHRLRALSNLWTVLDGRRAPNPVREVPEVQEPDAKPRGLPYALIETILGYLPDRGKPVPGVGKKPQLRAQRRAIAAGRQPKPLEPVPRLPSKTRIRLHCRAYSGLTPADLGRIRVDDIDLINGTLFKAGRKKGKGTKSKIIRLTPQAIPWFQAFIDGKCFGAYDSSSESKSFQLAVKKAREAGVVGIPDDIRPYDLRHSFGTALFRATGNIHAVQDLLDHKKIQTTHRYTLAAAQDVQAANVDRLAHSGFLGAVPAKSEEPAPSPATPEK